MPLSIQTRILCIYLLIECALTYVITTENGFSLEEPQDVPSGTSEGSFPSDGYLEESEERVLSDSEKLRHGRFDKFNNIAMKISQLNAIVPTRLPFNETILFSEGPELVPKLSKTSGVPALPVDTESDKVEYDGNAFEEDSDFDDDYDDSLEDNDLDKIQEQLKLLDRNDPAKQEIYVIANEMLKDQWIDPDVEEAEDYQSLYVDTHPIDEEYPMKGEYVDQEQQDGRMLETSGTRYRHHRLGSTSLKHDPDEVKQAMEHAVTMSRETSCQTPRPKVVSVQSVYPDSSKVYLPHCTVVHQCGDDAGCCSTASKTCAPKAVQKLELYFFTKTVSQGNMIEKLNFYNHTECACVQRTNSFASRASGFLTREEVTVLPEFRPIAIFSLPDSETDVPMQLKRCKCPSEFNPQNTTGSCECNCPFKQRACFRLKKGKEYFSLKDRLCIQNSDCEMPNCEFGNYNRRAGRCPRKLEQFKYRSKYTAEAL